jgi:hypothetical protein
MCPRDDWNAPEPMIAVPGAQYGARLTRRKRGTRSGSARLNTIQADFNNLLDGQYVLAPKQS